MPLRVFIVEDDENTKTIYAWLFRKLSGKMEICGQSSTAEGALKSAHLAKADLALVDISLPGMDGLQLTEKLRQLYPKMQVMVLTNHNIELYRELGMKAGADRIVSKADTAGLLKALEELLPAM